MTGTCLELYSPRVLRHGEHDWVDICCLYVYLSESWKIEECTVKNDITFGVKKHEYSPINSTKKMF